MTRPMVWKLRTTGLWAAQCGDGRTWIYATWREAYDRATHTPTSQTYTRTGD